MARRVLDIAILYGDGLNGTPKTAKSVYLQTTFQLCMLCQIRNASKLRFPQRPSDLCVIY